MADFYSKQAVEYAKGRPTYPARLFQFIVDKTPEHKLAWDVGAGNGQASRPLAEHYEEVIATETSAQQLKLAPKLPNVRYQHTSATMSKEELQQKVASESSVDLVAVATAIHWFNLPVFYEQAKWVLKKPHGVLAAWCYNFPEVSPPVDALCQKFYKSPYWRPENDVVKNGYSDLEFPFQPLNGLDGTGPFQIENKQLMSLDDYFGFLRSLRIYHDAKDQGVELLSRETIQEFTSAWSADGNSGSKFVNFPIYLRIGKVGHDVQRIGDLKTQD